MRNLLYLVFAVGLLSLQACKDQKSEEPATEETVSEETQAEAVKERYTAAASSVKFKDPKIAVMYDAYINLKTELVNSDVATSAKAAEDLLTAMANVGVEEETFLAAQFVVESNSLDGQREGFERVTKAIEPLILANIEGGAVYKQYCPMAFNNKGAYWLSNSEEIYNPYFGDMMLRCGRVADTLEVAEASEM